MRTLRFTLYSLLILATSLRAASYQVKSGAIGTVPFQIATPEKWNGGLILLAHGLRGTNAPITAEFDTSHNTAMGQLLREGYIVASTSFRRNGWITTDAIADLAALRQHVIKTHGTPALTLVVGTSMGGTIGTLLAEQPDQKLCQGVLAVAAALEGYGSDHPSFTHSPQIPLLFLSNQNEAAGPRAYVQAASHAPIAPVLWTVHRDGHANVSQAELLAAIHALVKFCQTGHAEADKDATLVTAPPASQAKFHDHSAQIHVTAVDPVYGNLTTDLVAADLATLGLKPGDRLTITSPAATATVPWVKSYADVPEGEWLAFLTADGAIQIARNLANAAQALKVKTGDPLTVTHLRP